MSTMQDMNNRIHQNRAQLSSKRPKFKENNRDLIYSEEEKSEGLIFKTVSEETLMELKKQIRTRAKKERKQEQMIYGIFAVLVLIALLKIHSWFN